MATTKKRRRTRDEDEEEAPRRRRRKKPTGDAPSRRASSGGKSVKLPMTGVDRGKKGGHRYPEGDYKMKIQKAERATSNNGTTQIKLTLAIVEPAKYKGKPFIDYLQITKKAMFRIGWLLDAVGLKWSQKTITLPLKRLEGKVIGVSLFDDEYNGRTRSKVGEYFSEEEIDDLMSGGGVDDDEDEDDDYDDEDEDEDEEEDEDEDDEDEDDDEEDEDDEDLDELDDDDL